MADAVSPLLYQPSIKGVKNLGKKLTPERVLFLSVTGLKH